jgi:hypothetical protein
MRKDTLENRMNLANNRFKVPHSKLLTGSLTDKYPVILDNGRTIIFIDDKSREAEIRERYELRKSNMILSRYVKPNHGAKAAAVVPAVVPVVK